MPLSADRILERQRLKQSVTRWRAIAIIIFVICAYALIVGKDAIVTKDFIARVNVNGFITDNQEFRQTLEKIAENDDIKAVIVSVDSPGGTAIGGEMFYNNLLKIRDKKPVVAVQRTLATSAGYMVSIASNEIFASKSTMTGSIGVIMQVPNVRELINKVGVDVQYVRTSPLKGAPTMFDPMDPEVRGVMQKMVDDFQLVFKSMVAEQRGLNDKELAEVTDGRVFNGVQAVELKLVDHIGGEPEAVALLKEKYGIDKDLKVRDVPLAKEKDKLNQVFKSVVDGNLLKGSNFFQQGLLSIWPNTAM